MPKLNSRLALAATAALVICSILIAADRASAQVSPKPRESGRQYAAWIPPGEYTAIVVSSNADTRNWAISLRTKGGVFPLTVTPQQNVVIPFERGWKITADDEARVLSEHIPFGDFTAFNQFGEENPILLSAWGITAGGPVPFVYREVR